MSGRANKLTAQIGEFLACAELGRQGFIATPFAGNVPEFDILVADEKCNSIPVQVKSSNSSNWPSNAQFWMDIEFDASKGRQNLIGKKAIASPELIHIYVSIAKTGETNHRFYILTKRDVQNIYIAGYKAWMDPRDWIRPRNPMSYDNRIDIVGLANYENNWTLIETTLMKQQTKQSPLCHL
jgi:hypothetical protein